MTIQKVSRRGVIAWLIASVMLLCFGCAGVETQLPQTQRAGDSYGQQEPAITYNINVDNTDSSHVTINVGTAAQDASQQGSAEQGQTGGTTGAVDNKPTISPTVSPTISGI